MHGGELLFSKETATAVLKQVRTNTGGLCPCDRGEHCPLLPDDVGAMLAARIPPDAVAV